MENDARHWSHVRRQKAHHTDQPWISGLMAPSPPSASGPPLTVSSPLPASPTPSHSPIQHLPPPSHGPIHHLPPPHPPFHSPIQHLPPHSHSPIHHLPLPQTPSHSFFQHFPSPSHGTIQHLSPLSPSLNPFTQHLPPPHTALNPSSSSSHPLFFSPSSSRSIMLRPCRKLATVFGHIAQVIGLSGLDKDWSECDCE